MESLLQLAMEEADELVLCFDRTGRIFYANKTAKTSLGFSDILSCNMKELFPSLFNDKEFVCPKGQQNADIYRANRTCFPVRVRFFSHPEGMLALILDASEVTQLGKLVENVDGQIKDALRVKSEFTANVTHELRTPVNGISGNTRELLELEDDPQKKKRLELIERGCRDMHAIINNVLDFSKLEAGKFTLENRPFVFRDMMDYAISNHRPKMDEKGLEFHVTIADDIPERIVGDELRIVQILNNLLSNAVKFTSVGKIILEVVKTAQINRRIELFFLVIDSGIGIAKENQDKLFQSFSQVDASISRRYGGTGLGLNITKQLIEMMGGSIQLESEYGKGSMFSFHIWVELPEGEGSEQALVQSQSTPVEHHLSDFDVEGQIWEFGSSENLAQLEKNLSKLILCIEMQNWEKAEGFADTVKKLTVNSPKEVKTTALRMKMAIQKEDHAKAKENHQKLKDAIEAWKAGDLDG